ncbi:RNA polymerase sigma factor SigJ [Kitasatospora sp. NPDC036755]|uniref:RNA polymerase sigma factor SigJ n=1 Tax=Kitasatospora sp. NPDC036755 TaxID=3154600 RepID=UPI0033CA792C
MTGTTGATGSTDAADATGATDGGAAGYRPLLFSIAYGMTGSVGDAEDLVQDTFLALARAESAGTAVADPRAYLTTAVTRLGINHLASARVRRESYVGQWLPEPVVTTAGRPGPAEHAELADTLSMAFLVLLEALSPVERAVFTLREAFGYGYPEVARMVGRGEANCRQILARARKRLAASGAGTEGAPGGAPAAPARRAEGEELARRFFAAAEGGDLDALLGMLAPDVVLRGDGGGKARALARTLSGARVVAQLLAGGLRRVRRLGARLEPARVNGRPGAVVRDAEGLVLSVVELDVDADGAVRAVHAVSNPDKLAHLGPLSRLGLLPVPEPPE